MREEWDQTQQQTQDADYICILFVNRKWLEGGNFTK